MFCVNEPAYLLIALLVVVAFGLNAMLFYQLGLKDARKT